MIKLYIDRLNQVSELEQVLREHQLDYEVEINKRNYGIDTPYITVYGVPLDEQRAIKWIKGR